MKGRTEDIIRQKKKSSTCRKLYQFQMLLIVSVCKSLLVCEVCVWKKFLNNNHKYTVAIINYAAKQRRDIMYNAKQRWFMSCHTQRLNVQGQI